MALSLLAFGKILWDIGSFVGSVFTGGGLKDILKTIDQGMDSDVEKEKVKAEVTKKWIDAQSSLLVGRTWWFQLFFVVPLGIYWTGLILAQFPFLGWTVHALPSPYYEWAAGIISALFLVDGSKAVLGRVLKK